MADLFNKLLTAVYGTDKTAQDVNCTKMSVEIHGKKMDGQFCRILFDDKSTDFIFVAKATKNESKKII